MIILDTNVVSELMRPTPNASVTAWVDRLPATVLHLTTISVAELRFGLAALPEGQRRTRLTERFETGLLPLFERRVLPFDDSATRTYASMRAEMRRAGQAIGVMDGLIAAIALAHDYELATRDTHPFIAAGVRVVDPFASSSA